MDFGPYTSFVASSYFSVVFVVALLIVWIAFDYRAQKARLRGLEQSGISRRSGRAATDIR